MTSCQPIEVLLVDDSEDLRLINTHRLRGAGIKVSEASDGLEALQVMQSRPIGVVVSDIQMPRMDGRDLLLTVRERQGESVFIIWAGDTPRNMVNEIMSLGVFEFMDKIGPTTLVEVVRAAIQFLESKEIKIQKLAGPVV